MPYNPQIDSNLVVSKEHKAMLKAVANNTGKFMRKIIEDLIENEYKKTKK
jgi:hypothetical protein